MSPKSSPSVLTSPIPRVDVKRSGISLGQTLWLRVVVRGAHGHRHPAPSSHLDPLGLWGLSIPGKLRPREADTGAPNPSSPQHSREYRSSKKCFKMARFDDNQGGMFGGGGGLGSHPGGVGAGTAPLPSAPGASGRVGNRVPAFNLNGFDFCGFVSPFMLIK